MGRILIRRSTLFNSSSNHFPMTVQIISILIKFRIDLVFSNVAEVYLDYAWNIVKA